MGFLQDAWNWAANLFRKQTLTPIDDGITERAFGTTTGMSQVMKDNIEVWYDLYTNNPPWERGPVKPLGIPGAICRELARYTMSEFHMTISGGPRADYLNEAIKPMVNNLLKDLEMGLAVGGFAIRPYLDQRGILSFDATGATAFTPTEFDGAGNAIAGVFREITTYKKQTYCRLEYHSFEKEGDGGMLYVIRNKAYKGEMGSGKEISLSEVPQWAELMPEVKIMNIDKPLFGYFRNPAANDIDTASQIGVSVFGGKANLDLLQKADEQWEHIYWEYKSGERKIITESARVSRNQIADRIFLEGAFTSEGNLFEVFNPDFRGEPLYQGLQWILKRLEYNTGLSYGSISDPPEIERTATEVLASKNRQRITVDGFQKALQQALDTAIYAGNAYCDLYGLAPVGEYEVDYNWGDGVIDDPDTIRQDKTIDQGLVSAGLMNDYEFRMKYFHEDENTAKANLPKMVDMVETVPVEDVVIE